ncbi:methyl-accepting chemotaxis protein [Geomonas sp. Red875]|uniref:Methyl-accepting chemotaxis protein n=2 Tax=Geomesophilobacter sediminis TaxID=2798584 RepID=A0A8J7M2Z7_9BACT|nr:methyl-accepting chemotaxis protein [Geomesophilobacter sediminis]
MTRLLGGFGTVLVLLLLVGIGGIVGLMQLSGQNASVGQGYATVEASQRARANLNLLRRFEKDILMNLQSPEKVRSYRTKYGESLAQYRKGLDELAPLCTDAKEKELYGNITRNSEEYNSGFNLVLHRIERGEIANTEAANAQLESVNPASHAAEAAATELADKNRKDVEQLVSEAAGRGRNIIITLAILLVLTCGAGLGICYAISRSIIAPVQQLTQQADALADGNLTVSFQSNGRDEIAHLATAFGRMAERLRETISRISDTSTRVAASSEQLSVTADQISAGAGEVASQTGTVATASEEMAATSGDIAQNCLMAAETSNRASETARSGVVVVQETISGMERIAEQVRVVAKSVESLGARSDQIGAIIGTIEDIADQTNLLALNAAIEAARAGEQGRGFAVVADEVRALAERTTRATREIGEMIKAIQQQTKDAVAAMEEGVSEVERGAASSLRSSDALQLILTQIEDVTAQVNQIATAAEQQTATTSEITTNIQQITQVVQVTTQSAAETAQASSVLSRESEQLRQLVSKFRLT